MKKIDKDTVPDDFTLSLALVDALPVLFFCASMVMIGYMFDSLLFVLGALVCIWAGAAKVIWKVIVVRRKKNVWWLFMQMRIAMPIGFVLMIVSLFLNSSAISLSGIISSILAMPSVIFFVLGLVGMVLMGVFAAKLDSGDLRSNWIEQTTNALAQLMFLIGIAFIMVRR